MEGTHSNELRDKLILEMNEELKKVTAGVSTANTKIELIKEKVDAVESKVDTLDNNVVSLDKKVIKIEESVNSLKERVESSLQDNKKTMIKDKKELNDKVDKRTKYGFYALLVTIIAIVTIPFEILRDLVIKLFSFLK